MHSNPTLWLGIVTFGILAALAVWNNRSAKAHQETGGQGHSTGLGGPNDPMA